MNPKPREIEQKFIPFDYPIMSIKKVNYKASIRKVDFMEVINARRSVSDFEPIQISELAELLFHCTKIEDHFFDDNGYLLSFRTTPSAGARHPIDLLVSLPETERELLYYNPYNRLFFELDVNKKNQETFFKEVNNNLSIKNACIIWFSIQHERTSTKYENPESLYWKDLGALLYSVQLMCAYLGFKSCPLGGLAHNTFYNLFETDKLLSGGGILVGK